LALLKAQRPADVLKTNRADIHDGALWIVQNKTGAKRAIEITGELAEMIQPINGRPRTCTSAWLIQDDDGNPRYFEVLSFGPKKSPPRISPGRVVGDGVIEAVG